MLIPFMRGCYQLHGEISFTTLKGVVFVPWTHGRVLPCYCTLLGIWLMVLIHGGVSLVISDLLKDILDTFNPLGMF